MDVESPIPGCLVLGIDGLVDAADIEQLKKRRCVLLVIYRYVKIRSIEQDRLKPVVD